MPSATGSQSSHASAQFLSSVLSQRGPNALPYEETVKWSIRQHLMTVIQDFPGLQAKTANFTHNDGRAANLLQAEGTVPMYYQDVKYNIPITMWLLEAYPRTPPLVFVSPTREMIIKPRHPYVDGSGMVNIPYLQQWVFPRSNLVELVQSLSLLFGQDPPLYSRPATMPTRPPPSPSPVPSFHGLNPMHTPAAASASVQSSPVPPVGFSGTPQSYQNHQPQPQSRPAFPPYLQQTPVPSPTRTENPADVFKRNAASSLSERVNRDTVALIRQREQELDSLFHTQSLLNTRASLIEEGHGELQREREGLEQQLQILLTNTDVVETWLKSNDRGVMEFDIDAVFEPVDALSKQMLESTSGDLAIDDILYSLDKAARDGAIPMDAYLKHVRMLAREQFFLRATSKKVKAVQIEAQVTNMAARAGHDSYSQ